MTCGYGPFDYGKCGCTKPGIHMIYGRTPYVSRGGFISDPPVGILRYPFIYPPSVDAWHSSYETPYQWIMPSSGGTIDIEWHRTHLPSFGQNPGRGTRVASAAGSEKVWAIESLINGPIGASGARIARYDAVTKLQELAITVDINFPSFLFNAPGTFPMAAVNETEFLGLTSSNLYHIDSSGTLTSDTRANSYNEGGNYLVAVSHIAPRYWPMVAGVVTRLSDGQTSLYYGPASVVTSGSDLAVYVAEEDRELVVAFSSTSKEWIAFDHHHSSWGGAYSVGGTVTMIQDGTTYDPSTVCGGPLIHGTIPATAHVARGTWHLSCPAENGETYVVSAHGDARYASLGGTGNWISVQQGGTEVWRSSTFVPTGPFVGSYPQCFMSSDRWLVIMNEVTLANSNAQPTWLSGNASGVMNLVRHDGSQRIACGQIQGDDSLASGPVNGVTTAYFLENGTDWGFGWRHDCVRNSNLVGYALPADLSGSAGLEFLKSG